MRNFILNEALGAYKSAKGMAWVSTAVSFTLILIFGASLYLSLTIFGILQTERRNVEIDVYLKEDLPRELKEKLYSTIQGLAGVKDIDIVTKEEALKIFKNRYPEYSDVVSVFQDIPFPESFVIHLKPTWKNPELMEHLIKEISVLPGVDEVYAGTGWIARLSKISAFFITVSIVLLIGLFLAISYVIYQTIRLIINSRRELIEILDLVGATKSTIEIPYLINGTLYGFVGGLFAAIVLKLSLVLVGTLLSYHLPDHWFIYPLLVLIGLVIGLIGSYLSFEEILP